MLTIEIAWQGSREDIAPASRGLIGQGGTTNTVDLLNKIDQRMIVLAPPLFSNTAAIANDRESLSSASLDLQVIAVLAA